MKRGVGALIGGAATGQVIMLVAYPILTRLYTPGELGVLSVYASTLAILIVISCGRLEQAIPLPRSESRAYSLLALALIATLLIAGATAIVALCIYWLDIKVALTTVALALLPIGVLLGGAYQALNMLALRRASYGLVARTRISQAAASTGTQIISGAIHLGSVGLVGGHMLGQSAGLISLVASIPLRDYRRAKSSRALKSTLRRYRKFATLGTPAALMNVAALQAPALIVASIFGIAAAGLYLIAARVVATPIDLIGRTTSQVFYAESAKFGTARAAEIRKLLRTTTGRLFVIGAVPAGVLALAGPFLFEWVFGEEWVQAGDFARLLSIMMLFSFASVPASQVFLLYEKQRLSVAFNFAKLCAAVVSLMLPALVGADVFMTVFAYATSMSLYYFAVLVAADRVLLHAEGEKKE